MLSAMSPRVLGWFALLSLVLACLLWYSQSAMFTLRSYGFSYVVFQRPTVGLKVDSYSTEFWRITQPRRPGKDLSANWGDDKPLRIDWGGVDDFVTGELLHGYSVRLEQSVWVVVLLIPPLIWYRRWSKARRDSRLSGFPVLPKEREKNN
jgi:hypothetical protein